MRNEELIRKELGEAQGAYQEAAKTKPHDEAAPISQKVKALQKELSDVLSEGAKPCADCGTAPIGLRHIHVVVPTNRKTFTYEVGCPACSPTKEKSYRAQGGNVAEAVQNWNAGIFIPTKER